MFVLDMVRMTFYRLAIAVVTGADTIIGVINIADRITGQTGMGGEGTIKSNHVLDIIIWLSKWRPQVIKGIMQI